MPAALSTFAFLLYAVILPVLSLPKEAHDPSLVAHAYERRICGGGEKTLRRGGILRLPALVHRPDSIPLTLPPPQTA
jgi:hypothetical protein